MISDASAIPNASNHTIVLSMPDYMRSLLDKASTANGMSAEEFVNGVVAAKLAEFLMDEFFAEKQRRRQLLNAERMGEGQRAQPQHQS
jgi:hypothetical protein